MDFAGQVSKMEKKFIKRFLDAHNGENIYIAGKNGVLLKGIIFDYFFEDDVLFVEYLDNGILTFCEFIYLDEIVVIGVNGFFTEGQE